MLPMLLLHGGLLLPASKAGRRRPGPFHHWSVRVKRPFQNLEARNPTCSLARQTLISPPACPGPFFLQGILPGIRYQPARFSDNGLFAYQPACPALTRMPWWPSSIPDNIALSG
ncbi:hypothetical protein CDD81_393 [Ophiocordyceps australis]|uniref:Uncharacterized protein n=1 Tax=Ophiocordyceps australis TaxID=1399860 RepID=A0A2C5Y2G0_9HYPO|nr:hypothetical protein CDD81_393 [Ophiocordyceps australis]